MLESKTIMGQYLELETYEAKDDLMEAVQESAARFSVTNDGRDFWPAQFTLLNRDGFRFRVSIEPDEDQPKEDPQNIVKI